MLQAFLKLILNEWDNKNNDWIQQDWATTDTSLRDIEILKELFPGHLISLRGDISWHSWSPTWTIAIFSSKDT